MAAEDKKQKSLLELIESSNADVKPTAVALNSTIATEECKEINLELSLGGCYGENESSNQGKSGGSNFIRPKVEIGENSKPNRSEIRLPTFFRATGIYNSQIYRLRLYQGKGSSLSATYPDTNLTLGCIPREEIRNRIPMGSSNSSSGVIAMTLLQAFLPRFIKGTPGFFPPLLFTNPTDGAWTSGSKRARTEDEEAEYIVVPHVMTDGGNPNGVTIHGFLGKYKKDQVFICCACHHWGLTPAEFVRHAGGEDVENPLQFIKVVFEVEEE